MNRSRRGLSKIPPTMLANDLFRNFVQYSVANDLVEYDDVVAEPVAKFPARQVFCVRQILPFDFDSVRAGN
jgi:hypothetical protein